MIHHHAGEELLLALAAGRLGAPQALVVGAHLEACHACRQRLHELQAVGGALLEASEPATLDPLAWTRTLQRIDAPAPAVAASGASAPPRARPALPPGVAWPHSLDRASLTGWRWMGPGMRYARVTLRQPTEGSVFLLRIGEGRSLPSHSHHGVELTQVLCGSFDDGRAVFGPGDFDAADDSVRHRPVVRPGATCVCLAYVGAPLRFEGRVAAVIAGWVGL